MALFALGNDMCWEMDRRSVTLLIVLGLLIAIDTIRHGILLDHFWDWEALLCGGSKLT